MTTLINAISPRQLAEILQQAGYRAAEVQHGNSVQIQSAAQGLNFAIAFGNAAPGVEGGFSDFSFSCPLQIQGDLDPQLLESWNSTRRFARLSRQGHWLVLVQDVLIAGGVSPEWLRAQCELWDGILREYLRHLQTPLTPAATATPAQ